MQPVLSSQVEADDLVDISFVDDALYLQAPPPSINPLDLAGDTVDCVHEAMLTHGFTVNYKRAKSALFIIPGPQHDTDLRQ
eukprot:2952988-Pyramimonas_sp.AAC.1